MESSGETCRRRERRADDGRDVAWLTETWLPQDGPVKVRYRNVYWRVVCYSCSNCQLNLTF